MLAKMGWKGEGAGLGKEQQGTSVNLRVVRRIDGLGIGAENDAFGDKGWSETNAGFHGVLANLKAEYGPSGTGVGGNDDEDNNDHDDDNEGVEGSNKEKKRRKKKEKKRLRNKINATEHKLGSGLVDNDGGAGVRLPRNRVQVGHARKMREAKDIRNKSVEDMAAIFGVKAEQYKPPPAAIYSSSNDTAVVVDNNDEGKLRRKQKWKERKVRWKELPMVKDDKHGDDSDGNKKKHKKKKRKRLKDGDDDQGN